MHANEKQWSRFFTYLKWKWKYNNGLILVFNNINIPTSFEKPHTFLPMPCLILDDYNTCLAESYRHQSNFIYIGHLYYPKCLICSFKSCICSPISYQRHSDFLYPVFVTYNEQRTGHVLKCIDAFNRLYEIK